jgi:hypothetical protein
MNFKTDDPIRKKGINYSKIQTKTSVKIEKNMQTSPSGRDDTIHKQLLIPKQTTPSIKKGKNMQTPSTNKLIPKRTTPSVNKLNYSKKWTTPSVNKLNYNKNGRHHLLKMKRICRRHHLQGRTPSTKN